MRSGCWGQAAGTRRLLPAAPAACPAAPAGSHAPELPQKGDASKSEVWLLLAVSTTPARSSRQAFDMNQLAVKGWRGAAGTRRGCTHGRQGARRPKADDAQHHARVKRGKLQAMHGHTPKHTAHVGEGVGGAPAPALFDQHEEGGDEQGGLRGARTGEAGGLTAWLLCQQRRLWHRRGDGAPLPLAQRQAAARREHGAHEGGCQRAVELAAQAASLLLVLHLRQIAWRGGRGERGWVAEHDAQTLAPELLRHCGTPAAGGRQAACSQIEGRTKGHQANYAEQQRRDLQAAQPSREVSGRAGGRAGGRAAG